MGVIDLDARVKKLEQGGGGGAEIDQIEADLTALGNTVADLEIAVDNLSGMDVSDMITFNADLDFAEGFPKISITRIGNMCFLQCAVDISTGASQEGSDTVIGTLDESIRPLNRSIGGGTGESGTARSCVIDTDGTVLEDGGDWAQFSAFWKIATT